MNVLNITLKTYEKSIKLFCCVKKRCPNESPKSLKKNFFLKKSSSSLFMEIGSSKKYVEIF